MLRYGLPLVPSGAALWGLALLDRLILERLDGLDEVGLYGVANRVASVLHCSPSSPSRRPGGPSSSRCTPRTRREERRVRPACWPTWGSRSSAGAGRSGLFAEEALDIVAPGYEGAAPNAVVPARRLGRLPGRRRGRGLAGITIARSRRPLATHTVAALAVNVALCFALIPPIGAGRRRDRHAGRLRLLAVL